MNKRDFFDFGSKPASTTVQAPLVDPNIEHLRSTSTQTTALIDPEHEFQEIGVKYNNQTFWKLYGQILAMPS